MHKQKVTAATLEALLQTVAAANRDQPSQGDQLFRKIVERIELARACAVDKPVN